MTIKFFPQQGFTLMEAMVAVALLSMAITGPLTIAAQGLRTAQTAQNQTVATYLAQDAMEYIRFGRDTNRLQGYDWLAGGSNGVALTPCISADNSMACTVDTVSNTVATCAVATCTAALQFNTSTGYYSYSGGTGTAYTRTVRILTPVAGKTSEAAITSIVSWVDSGGTTRSVTVRDNLLNWE